MLVRWVNLSDGKQRVRFKYVSSTDLEKPTFNKVKKEFVSDLMEQRVILQGMYTAFRRARAAASAAAYAFSPPVFRDSSRHHPLIKEILRFHFMNPATEEHLDTIYQTFRATADGLSGPDVTLSDSAGRDSVRGQTSDGYVQPKKTLITSDGRSINGAGKYLAEACEDFEAAVLPVCKWKRDELGLSEEKEEKEKEQERKKEEGDKIQEHCQIRKLARIQHQQFALGIGAGNIHIQFSLCMTRSIDWLARAIIHEATHKFRATGDYAYAYEEDYQFLRPEHAIQNADSFAFAAVSIHRAELATPLILENDRPVAVNDSCLRELKGLKLSFKKQHGS